VWVFALSVLASLLAAEIYMTAPLLAKWLVRWHARRLPSDLAERMLEEMTADLESYPGHLGKLLFAVGLLAGGGANALRRAHRERPVPKSYTLRAEPGVFRIESTATLFPPKVIVRAGVATSAGASSVTGVSASLKTTLDPVQSNSASSRDTKSEP
jgi:hypothetical protein